MNKTTLKKIAIGFLVLVIAFFIYRTITKTTSNGNTPVEKNGLAQNSAVDATQKNENIEKLLSLLQSVSTINISDKLFSKIEFLSLKDFSLKEEEEKLDLKYGRKNPFLPIGNETAGEFVTPDGTGAGVLGGSTASATGGTISNTASGTAASAGTGKTPAKTAVPTANPVSPSVPVVPAN